MANMNTWNIRSAVERSPVCYLQAWSHFTYLHTYIFTAAIEVLKNCILIQGANMWSVSGHHRKKRMLMQNLLQSELITYISTVHIVSLHFTIILTVCCIAASTRLWEIFWSNFWFPATDSSSLWMSSYRQRLIMSWTVSFGSKGGSSVKLL